MVRNVFGKPAVYYIICELLHGKQIVFEQMIAFELSRVKIVLEVNINLDIQRLSTF